MQMYAGTLDIYFLKKMKEKKQNYTKNSIHYCVF